MHPNFYGVLRNVAWLVVWPVHAAAPLPPVDLLVELRPNAAAGYTVSTESTNAMGDEAIALRVRNGEKATFERRTLHAAQHVDAVQGGERAPSAHSTLYWLPTGQKVVVQPRWPGGSQPATVEVQIHADSLAAGTGVLPEQAQRSIQTVLTIPLNKWAPLIVPHRPAAGTYSSEEVAQPAGLQLRVSHP